MSVKYQSLDDYDKYKDKLIKRKLDFNITKTTYSRKIKLGKLTVIFNEDSGSDFELLSLINIVRQNAKDYLATSTFEQREEYIHFFDLFNKPDLEQVVYKIDVRSAYWKSALKKGIIKAETDIKLKQIYEGVSAKIMKSARLKALGSLATQKNVDYYVKGKYSHSDEPYTEPTKVLYMQICRDVDELMRQCVQDYPEVIYYYWDCIFAPAHISQEIIQWFKEKNYDVKVEETKLEFVKIFSEGGGYLLSQSDDKAYLVRADSYHLLYG